MSVDQPSVRLQIADWDRPIDDHDAAMLARCTGPTLDVGCGPGRFTEALAHRGHVALGIDIVTSAVSRTQERGASALCRSVFDALPGEGRWETALLADGNLGIGGDPVTLLRRLRQLLDPRGRVIAEVAAPGASADRGWASVETVHESRVVPWSVVGVDRAEEIAERAGLAVVDRLGCCSRWCVVLEDAVA